VRSRLTISGLAWYKDQHGLEFVCRFEFTALRLVWVGQWQ